MKKDEAQFEVFFYKEPFEHFKIPNFFTKEELDNVNYEINFIESTNSFTRDQNLLSAAKDGKEYKSKRKGVFLAEFYNRDNFRSKSFIYRGLKKVFTPDFVKIMGEFSTFGKLLEITNNDGVLISQYCDGDYYKPHFDVSIFTFLTYVWEEKTFKGGDLVFVDYNYKIEPENNSCIIIPGCIRHGVTPVVSLNGNLEEVKRTCISMFVNFYRNDN